MTASAAPNPGAALTNASGSRRRGAYARPLPTVRCDSGVSVSVPQVDRARDSVGQQQVDYDRDDRGPLEHRPFDRRGFEDSDERQHERSAQIIDEPDERAGSVGPKQQQNKAHRQQPIDQTDDVPE